MTSMPDPHHQPTTPELQKRTGLGLLLVFVGYIVELTLPHVSSAMVAQIASGARGSASGGLSAYFALSSLFSTIVIVAIQGAGIVLTLRRMGAYAQFALASFVVYLGFAILRTMVGAAPLLSRGSHGVSHSSSIAVYGGAALVGSLLFALSSIALLVLLRRATSAAGGRPSIVATILVCVGLSFNLLRGMAFTVVLSRLPISSLALFNNVSMAVHAVICLSFMWLAFRARSATLGMVLGAEGAPRDAYR
ncbi:MAG: hypothetical protein U0174_13340 [Polyangiaceae bacterium]